MKKKSKFNQISPFIRKVEKIGLKPKKNGVPGKYLVGYKLAAKTKRECVKFLVENCKNGNAEQGRKFFYNWFQIDWNNPYILNW